MTFLGVCVADSWTEVSAYSRVTGRLALVENWVTQTHIHTHTPNNNPRKNSAPDLTSSCFFPPSNPRFFASLWPFSFAFFSLLQWWPFTVTPSPLPSSRALSISLVLSCLQHSALLAAKHIEQHCEDKRGSLSQSKSLHSIVFSPSSFPTLISTLPFAHSSQRHCHGQEDQKLLCS